MKARLAMILALLAVLAAAAASTTRASVNGPTCGTHTGKYAAAYSLARSTNSAGGAWVVRWDQNCGAGGTVAFKIQSRASSVDAWVDQSDSLYRTLKSQANQESPIVDTVSGGCDAASAWRVVVADANGESVASLNPRSAAGC